MEIYPVWVTRDEIFSQGWNKRGNVYYAHRQKKNNTKTTSQFPRFLVWILVSTWAEKLSISSAPKSAAKFAFYNHAEVILEQSKMAI